jgi:NADH-quinone oxidoreductase subunit L
MPVTFWTFIAGTLALAGVWPLSGFFSKDAILAQAQIHNNVLLFTLGILVAALTAFYMFRLVFVVFFGGARGEAADHVHESPPVMILPLRALATLSIIGGCIGIEIAYGRFFSSEAGHELTVWQQLIFPFQHAPVAAVLGLVAAALGIAGAYAAYWRATADPLPARLGAVSTAMRNRFYFDELYEATVIRLHDMIAAVAAWIDKWLVAGLAVRGTHGTTELVGRALRLLQTGNLQTYAFLFALGVALVLYLALVK